MNRNSRRPFIEATDAAVGTASLVRALICCGENLYMRWGFRELLDKQAADIIMPDIQKVGGLSERVVKYSEITRLRDIFGHQCLREKKYTVGQIDTAWSAPIESDFTRWPRENMNQLPVAKEQVQEIIKERTK